MTRVLLIAAVLPVILLLSSPADAAGVGFSIPKLRVLTVGDGTNPVAISVGGSVQVIGTSVNISNVLVKLGLDYGYTRNFGLATNYSFFDLELGAGLPFGITRQFYVTPALDTHTLLFVASPESLDTPAFGLGPRLTMGFKPANNVALELSLSHAFLATLSAKKQARQGGMSILELSGSYSF